MADSSALQAAVGLIASFEGCRLQAYPDPASPLAKGTGTDGRPWTVGYGCTGQGIGPGTVWSQQEADGALAHRVNAIQEAIAALVKTPLNSNQLAALTSLVYNIGTQAFSGSTLLEPLNAGNYQAAADQFLRWDHAHGAVVPGLLNRRYAERALFLK